MTQALVRQALETALKTYADGASLPVAWENVDFTPSATAHLRAFVLPAGTESPDLQRAGRTWTGIFQVTIVTPHGAGPGAAEALVTALSAVFDPSAPLTAGGLRVYLLQPLSAAPGIQERDRWAVPCSVPYRADSY